MDEAEKYLALLIGIITPKFTNILTNLVIYSINTEDKTFEVEYVRHLPKIFSDISDKMEFSIKNKNHILFVNHRGIISYNFASQKVTSYFVFKMQLNCSPDYFVLNKEQNIVMVANKYDTIQINLKADTEWDIGSEFGIGLVKQIIYYKNFFYVISNKVNRKIGYFLLKINEVNPVMDDSSYIVNWDMKHEIDDANINILEQNEQTYLMVSQKTSKVETYNIIVINLNTKLIIYRYEIPHLWESPIKCLLLSTKEFLKISKDGLSMIKVFADSKKKILKNKQGWTWI